MATKKFEIGVTVRGDDRLSPEIKKAETSFGRFRNSIKANALAIGVSITAVVVAFRGLSRAIGSTITAAQAQEDAVRALDAALIPMGRSAGEASKALQEQAAALQLVTKFGDETIIKGQALLASFTRNTEQIKAATEAALDLSAATGTDLNAAFLLLGKAATGETSALSRYGIVLDEGIPKTERFAAAIEKINIQFGGQAREQVKTFSGAIAQLTNAFGDLQEAVGESITKNEALIGKIKVLKDTITENTENAKEFAQVWTFIGTTVFAGLADKFGQLTNAARTFGRTIAGTQAGIDGTEVSMRALTRTAARLNLTTEELAAKLAEAGKRATEESIAIAKAERSAAINTATIERLAKAYGFTAKASELLSDADERRLRIEKELLGLSEGFADAVSALGVTLESEVNKAIEENNALLEKANALYRAGAISPRDYARTVRAVAEANREATASLIDSADGFDDVAESVRIATDRQQRYGEVVGLTTQRIVEQNNANQVGGRIRLENGGSILANPSAPLFPGLGGGTFTSFISLPTVTADGRVSVPGASTIQNPNFVRVA